MDFIPDDILNDLSQVKESQNHKFLNAKRKGTSRNRLSDVESSQSMQIPKIKTEESSGVALKPDSLIKIIGSRQRLSIKNREYIVFLSNKLSNIFQSAWMRELSPIGNAEQLHKFKKESQTELGNIRKIFEESINQVIKKYITQSYK
ncbi:hypothetical protein KSF78_0000578 [Schistosoma japonicum]|nr:hypothetical protein KSF78_0000578 [Schistosoma japonicum]